MGEVLDAFDFLEGLDIVVVVNNVPCRDRERALKERRLPPPLPSHGRWIGHGLPPAASSMRISVIVFLIL